MSDIEQDFYKISLEDASEEDKYGFAYDLGEQKRYVEAIDLFKQLYNPQSKNTLRKGLCMIAKYFADNDRIFEAIDGYKHALLIKQADNPDEDLQYYVPDYIEQLIQQLQNQKPNYKIAVYAICGNEIDNLKDGMTSMGEADYICVLDTGSTDGSYELLQQYQKDYPQKVFIGQKTYNPGRFDAPRNDSLQLVPHEADICICTDPDERLVSGGAAKVRGAWHPKCERMYYLYAGSHLANGAPARVFGYDKIHRNSGEGYGKFPIHEALFHDKFQHASLADGQYVFLEDNYIMLHHYPKHKDTRTNYLPLLEQRFEENKDDFYSHIYLSHEYLYQKQYQKGLDFILNYSLPYYQSQELDPIYMSNIYMFLGDCYDNLGKYTEAIQAYQTGITADPNYRDTYLHLAKTLITTEKYTEAIQIINDGFLYSRRYVNWLEGDTTGYYKPGEILTIAYVNIGAIDMARQCAQIALSMEPNNKDLQENYNKLF